MIPSLDAPSHPTSLSHAPSEATSLRIPGGHARDHTRAMVIFLIATLAIWLSARITLY